jgi:uncharacterized protein YjiS (DUF1127 family)
MDSSRRAIFISGLSVTAGNRSYRHSYSGRRSRDLIRGTRFWGSCVRFWRWCAECSERSRQREALSQLDDDDLKDIGMTRQQANAEAAKPFWK